MLNNAAPFITIENFTVKLIDEETDEVEIIETSVYGFTSKFYMFSSFIIIFLLGTISGQLLLK
jgi:hypothetical protein